jgi:hypothetical protein
LGLFNRLLADFVQAAVHPKYYLRDRCDPCTAIAQCFRSLRDFSSSSSSSFTFSSSNCAVSDHEDEDQDELDLVAAVPRYASAFIYPNKFATFWLFAVSINVRVLFE